MERYKDRDHAFLVGMLFVLMFLWNSAFVCICFVWLPPLVSDGPSVCLCPSVSRGLGVCVSLCFSGLCLSVCLSRTSCVNFSVCSVCLRDCCCLVLAWAAWSFLLSGSVCVSPVCVVSVLCLLFLSFSFVRLSFGFFRLFFLCFVPSFVQCVSCSSFFSREYK